MNRVCNARTLTSLRATYTMGLLGLKKTQCSFVGHMEKPYPSYGLFGPPEIPCSAPVGRPKEFSLDQVEICNNKISAFISHFTYWCDPPLSYDKEDRSSDDEYENRSWVDDEDDSYDVEKKKDPCFYFYKYMYVYSPEDPKEQISQLDLCWEQDPLTTLKLICNLRSVRGAGRSCREEFYTAAIWLYKYHPKTLAHNVRTFAEFGYLKDLLEILYRILEGPEVRYNAFIQRLKQQQRPENVWLWGRTPVRSIVPWEMNVVAELTGIKSSDKENARLFRKEKIILMAKRARDMYNCDENYRFLHDQIADLFAQLLKSDIEFLKSGNIGKISLAAKWCPSLNSSYDRVTLLCESIARRVFPYEEYNYRVIEDSHYAYRVRDRLRKQVLVPLRKALRLPEVYMSSKQWNLLPYHQVSSLAMELKKTFFFEHDVKRFLSYLKTLKMSQTDIILRPPNIMDLLRYRRNGVLVEMQYMRMVEDLRKKGIFQNCIAFYANRPFQHENDKELPYSPKHNILEAPYWIGLLVSELSESPWKGKVIGCPDNPQILKIEGNSLSSKLEFLKSMEGDYESNIDLSMMFEKILETALHWNLSKDKMVKRVIICWKFTRFPILRNWETKYEAMRSKFERNGYSLPHVLVLWNAASVCNYAPLVYKMEGLSLTIVEFLSKNTINQFVEADGNLDLISLMESAISGEKFNKLQVHD